MYTFPCGCAFPVLPDDRPVEGAVPLLDFSFDDVRFDCPAVWGMLAKGRTQMVFQLEKPLGQQWSKKARPESVDHLAALGAILRPGCLGSYDEDGVSATEHYCRRKNDEEPVDLPHPDLEPILGPTYGVLWAQEQFMQIAARFAGFDLNQVEKLRKNISKKRLELLLELKEMFLGGCSRIGVLDEKTALAIWSQIEACGRYAFCRAHAVSYAIIGYYTAWAKCHVPVAAFTAWLACAHEKADAREEIRLLVEEARAFGVPVCRPDLTALRDHFHTDRVRVHFGLADIKGVGETSVERLRGAVRAAERYLGRPLPAFSWVELLTFVLANQSAAVTANLILAGACDSWGVPRARMAAEFDAWKKLTNSEQAWARLRMEFQAEGLTAAAVEKNLAACKARLAQLAGDGSADERADLKETIRLDKLRLGMAALPPVFSVEGLLAQVAAHGSTKRRSGVVEGLHSLLRNPPTPHTDSPRSIVADEENLLGVAVTAHRLDRADLSESNCTVGDFLAGGRRGPVLLGVEVAEVRPTRTKKGKSPGQPMAQVVLKDRTGVLRGVCFPGPFAECGHLLAEGALLLVQGVRDLKDASQFVVQKAWPPRPPGPRAGAVALPREE